MWGRKQHGTSPMSPDVVQALVDRLLLPHFVRFTAEGVLPRLSARSVLVRALYHAGRAGPF